MTKKELFHFAKEGIVKGFFWSIGVTLGFAVVTTLLVLIFSRVETLPIIGNFVAGIVKATLESLGTALPGH